jgi:poly-gamma-glutamate capsule biosynthesis protein CapA/YwtB (metallophosphatase superfamily)
MTNMRSGLKALAAILVIVALCAPLMLWPVDEAEPIALGSEKVTVTVPPTVVVATTIPGLATTTTTTEAPAEPTPTTTSISTTTTTGPITVTVAAIGDVTAPDSVLRSVRDSATGSYSFGEIFAPVAPYLAHADYTVAFLEPRLAGPRAAYGDEDAPNAPRELAFALQAAGVDLVATANTHSLDLGWDGLVGTLDRLEAAGLAHVGTSRSATERAVPVIADVGGIRVAFLNYTASVAGRLPADKKDFGVNLLTLETITEDAMTARSWGADAVVALLNYGTEFAQEPSDKQVALSQEILDHGVDAILGSGARVVQPIGHRFTYASWRNSGTYVAYSLGEFLSAEEAATPTGGMITYLHLEQNGLRTYVTGVSYLPIYVQASTQKSGDKSSTSYRVLPVMPGLVPDTDVPLSDEDRRRMTQIWEETRGILYRPDENISPLVLADLLGF